MTARQEFEPDAGEWAAFRDEPARRFNPETKKYETVPGETRRAYLHSRLASSGNPDNGLRFDTKAEALAAARAYWPARAKGCRIGAERITKKEA